MPPKKKRKVGNPDKAEPPPGTAKKHIYDKFSSLPDDVNNVRNGHVLYIYMTIGKSKSRIATKKFLETHFSSVSIRDSLDADIKRIVSQTLASSKFRKLTDDNEFSRFAAICDERFSLKSEISHPVCITGEQSSCSSSQQGPSYDYQNPTPQANPVPCTPDMNVVCTPSTSSSKSTRSQSQLTPRKARMKRRLTFLSSLNSQMKKRYQEKCLDLKNQLKTPKKVVNQALQRKIKIILKRYEEIRVLKRKLLGNQLSNELVKTKIELNKLKTAHTKLLKYRRLMRAKKKKVISATEYKKLKSKVSEQNALIKDLQNQNLVLQEEVEELKSTVSFSKVDGKTYSSKTRMKVFDCVVNNVPTASIPVLLNQFSKRSGIHVDDIPSRSAVEMMARELGAVAELQAAEMILTNSDSTVGFDATTQEGTHINEVHFTTRTGCVSAAVDELAGGTAEDYANHICQTVDNMAKTYSYFIDGSSYQGVRTSIINNITNSMSDRCAANHAALRLVNSQWGKTLNELNCHLHPLDSIASSTRSALKGMEESRGQLYGQDCIAANIIVQMSKLRYKDGKGDPQGFTSFLDRHNLPRNVLPRYRGNRLHILFHNAGILIRYYEEFSEMLKSGTSLGGLRSSLLKDFSNETAKVELQVIGLLGKHLTGPWMQQFYTSVLEEINHIDGIQIVKEVLLSLKEMVNDPTAILMSTKDFFGKEIIMDQTLEKLRAIPTNPQFSHMMQTCLENIIRVLERQYEKYFNINITEKLRDETASARSHNIDSEEIMGMFSAAQKKSPNATLCFLSCKMHASENKTVEYLDALSEDRREEILIKAVKIGRKQRGQKQKKQRDLRDELINRQKQKEQQKDMVNRRKLEKTLKNEGIEGVKKAYPALSYSQSEKLEEILEGRVVGKKICHVWAEDDGRSVMYNGLIRKFYASRNMYKIAYWNCQSEEDDDATDYNISKFELASDLLRDDLMFAD